MLELSRLPQPVAESWDWRLAGLRRRMDNACFFHEPTGAARDQRETAAKAICQRCPVVGKCRSHALEVHETSGIRGGLGEGELRAMLAERARRT
ncbi:WhiB family transcriptional regulator [Lentzea jiangxiensis]|uniref:WhiB family transcriptional regulator, redox-sensing transcriptional regulator n=1 Tax=Lentzea jiangxiensis TaxID=641025 RepID=A0A1H0LDD1_9PSEU|nr:WhiB family transcriptional regulator [Lentzea jiangxiensis]SDO66001.1 WhiB family transcriptional regulator, redox-sensing transcriptional regulator [Lentzea jiangxiensis]